MTVKIPNYQHILYPSQSIKAGSYVFHQVEKVLRRLCVYPNTTFLLSAGNSTYEETICFKNVMSFSTECSVSHINMESQWTRWRWEATTAMFCFFLPWNADQIRETQIRQFSQTSRLLIVSITCQSRLSQLRYLKVSTTSAWQRASTPTPSTTELMRTSVQLSAGIASICRGAMSISHACHS
jgi:hypothetical protein